MLQYAYMNRAWEEDADSECPVRRLFYVIYGWSPSTRGATIVLLSCSVDDPGRFTVDMRFIPTVPWGFALRTGRNEEHATMLR